MNTHELTLQQAEEIVNTLKKQEHYKAAYDFWNDQKNIEISIYKGRFLLMNNETKTVVPFFPKCEGDFLLKFAAFLADHYKTLLI